MTEIYTVSELRLTFWKVQNAASARIVIVTNDQADTKARCQGSPPCWGLDERYPWTRTLQGKERIQSCTMHRLGKREMSKVSVKL